MDSRLTQTQSQKLILAPQLRQFLKLLELPIFELDQKIEQEIAENPALEEVSDVPEEEPAESSTDSDTPEDTQVRDIFEEMARIERMRKEDTLDRDFAENDPSDAQRKLDYRESILTKPPTLAEYLTWQIGLLDFTEAEKKIAQEIVGNINDEGQLVATLQELASATQSTEQEVERVLSKIQSLDPPGVGGRDLKEILLIQLIKQPGDTTTAQTIIHDYLPLLERKQFDQIARALNIPLKKIKEIYAQIGHLEPKPGRIFYREKPNFVIPDATVSISPSREDELVVEMNNDFIPSLRINATYREMVKQKNIDPTTKTFLREKIQSGLDLIRALSQRKSTLNQITEELVKAQRDFFTKGFAYLKPLRLKDVAETVGVHESTISRAIQNKYLATPQGTIPYKSFFSNRLDLENGHVESQKSAMEHLKQLIANEDKRKPLSDARLVQLLEADGIKIARRTVAKYRELLKILPAYLRKN
ncbi:MAG: RNA polymerase factor sigma-54 [Candidatus Omnitrophica bacterium]|nr:RNA polymerase factor sigma-54 [Candidatus Omnitrophota bacterium]